MTRRPRSLLGRLVDLVRGTFAGWVKDRERRTPRAVYEQAIEQRTRHYAELKRAVAGILFMRNKLEAEIAELRGELARTLGDIRRAVSRRDDEAALALIAHKQRLGEDLERAESELDKVRREAEEAKGNLTRFREEIRELEREKVRALASLANAAARRRIQEAFEGLSLDGEMRALESVRAHVERARVEGQLGDDEAGDEVAARVRAIRQEADHEAARAELDELKRQLGHFSLPARSATPVIVEAAAATS